MVLRIAHSRKVVAALIVHSATGDGRAGLLSNVVLNLMLHPVLIDSLGAGLRGALVPTSDRVAVLDLHLEHTTLVFCGIRRLK